MDTNEVMALYETVADITTQMLTAARNGDWEHLAELETCCARQVEILKTDAPTPLTGEIRVRKVQIIKKILADDREIRNIAEPWTAKLSQMINSTGAERKLSHAYGASVGG